MNQELLQLTRRRRAPLGDGLVEVQGRVGTSSWKGAGSGALLALPGIIWLSLFFLVAFYAVIAVAFGNTNTLSELVPFWSPTQWNVGYVLEVLQNIWSGGQFLTVFLRTFAYVAIALAISLLIGYPIAYFAARHAGRLEGASCCSLLVLPFWINYLMRMLAWINLLSPDGWGTKVAPLPVDRPALHQRSVSSPSEGGWLEGQSATVVIALIYGYIPFLIIPLFAALDRIDQRQIEAARDLGASPFSAFRRDHAAALDARDPRRGRPDRAADVRRLLHRTTSSRPPRRRP